MRSSEQLKKRAAFKRFYYGTRYQRAIEQQNWEQAAEVIHAMNSAGYGWFDGVYSRVALWAMGQNNPQAKQALTCNSERTQRHGENMKIHPRSLRDCRDSKAGIPESVRMTVVMSLAMSEALAEEAKRLGTSASEIVRELIKAYLEGQK